MSREEVEFQNRLLHRVEQYLDNLSGGREEAPIQRNVAMVRDTQSALEALDKMFAKISSLKAAGQPSGLKGALGALLKNLNKIADEFPLSAEDVDYAGIAAAFTYEILGVLFDLSTASRDLQSSPPVDVAVLRTFRGSYEGIYENSPLLFRRVVLERTILPWLQRSVSISADDIKILTSVEVLEKWKGVLDEQDILSLAKTHVAPRLIKELEGWDAMLGPPLHQFVLPWYRRSTETAEALAAAGVTKVLVRIVNNTIRKANLFTPDVWCNLSLRRLIDVLPVDVVNRIMATSIEPRLSDGTLLAETFFGGGGHDQGPYHDMIRLMPLEKVRKHVHEVMLPVCIVAVRNYATSRQHLRSVMAHYSRVAEWVRSMQEAGVGLSEDIETLFGILLEDVSSKARTIPGTEEDDRAPWLMVEADQAACVRVAMKAAPLSYPPTAREPLPTPPPQRQRGRLIDIIGDIAVSKGILFMPKIGQRYLGKDLYEVGDHVIYIDNSVVFRQSGAGAWTPTSLEDLFC